MSDLGPRTDTEPGEVFAGFQTVIHKGEGSNPTASVSYHQVAVHRAQFGQTLSISHPLHGHVGLSGELWHVSQPLSTENAVGLLLARSYAVNRLPALDGGINLGRTGSSTRWDGFVGLTYLFPKRLW